MLTELEVINSVLSGAGYSAIASVDSQHPAARSARAQVALAQKQVNSKRYWYNSAQVTLDPDEDGIITVPQNTLNFRASDRRIAQQGRTLYNVESRSGVFTESVCGVLHENTPIERMPFVAQELVRTRARVGYYTQEGGQVQLQLMMQEVNEAMMNLNAENIAHQDINWYDGYEGRRKWYPNGGHSVITPLGRPE